MVLCYISEAVTPASLHYRSTGLMTWTSKVRLAGSGVTFPLAVGLKLCEKHSMVRDDSEAGELTVMPLLQSTNRHQVENATLLCTAHVTPRRSSSMFQRDPALLSGPFKKSIGTVLLPVWSTQDKVSSLCDSNFPHFQIP